MKTLIEEATTGAEILKWTAKVNIEKGIKYIVEQMFDRKNDFQAFMEFGERAMLEYAQHVCKDKKNNIEEREKRFTNAAIRTNHLHNILRVSEVHNTNGKSFIEYWTEHGENDRKMRFEKETSFNIKKRLLRWKNYNYNKGNKNSYYDKYPDLFNEDGTPKTIS